MSKAVDTECGEPREDVVMADQMGLSTVFGASAVSGVGRDVTRAGVLRSRGVDQRTMLLVAIHVGCLVLALVCVLALAL